MTHVGLEDFKGPTIDDTQVDAEIDKLLIPLHSETLMKHYCIETKVVNSVRNAIDVYGREVGRTIETFEGQEVKQVIEEALAHVKASISELSQQQPETLIRVLAKVKITVTKPREEIDRERKREYLFEVFDSHAKLLFNCLELLMSLESDTMCLKMIDNRPCFLSALVRRSESIRIEQERILADVKKLSF